MIAEIYDHLVSEAASALGVEVREGTPNWTRPALTPPIAALEIAAKAPTLARIGQKPAKHALALRLYVFAQNESPGLAGMLEQVGTLEKAVAEFKVDAARVTVAFGEGQRYINQSGSAQEDHGFTWFLTATY